MVKDLYLKLSIPKITNRQVFNSERLEDRFYLIMKINKTILTYNMTNLSVLFLNYYPINNQKKRNLSIKEYK